MQTENGNAEQTKNQASLDIELNDANPPILADSAATQDEDDAKVAQQSLLNSEQQENIIVEETRIDDNEAQQVSASKFTFVKNELLEIFSLSWPTVITNICNSLMQLTDLSSVGHLNNSTFMAAAGIGLAYYNMLLYICFGLSTGLDTLTSQAVGASK